MKIHLIYVSKAGKNDAISFVIKSLFLQSLILYALLDREDDNSAQIAPQSCMIDFKKKQLD